MPWSLRSLVCFGVLSAGCLIPASGANAQTRNVRVNAQGEEVIAYQTEPVRSSVFRQEVTRWICGDVVEVTIMYAQSGTDFGVASIRVTLGGVPVSQAALDELKQLANRQMFRIYGLCDDAEPIALVNWIEDYDESSDGATASAVIHGRRINLSELPLVSD